MKMKMTNESKLLFATEILKAKAKGMTHFAKACGCPTMKFGKSIEEAERKAIAADRSMFRDCHPGMKYFPPSVQSGEI
jgi:uncharacterized protein YneR